MRARHPYVPRPSSTILALALAVLLPLGISACGEPPPDGSPPQEQAGLTPGSGSWTFTGTPLAEAQPVTVWYHLPEGLSADAPVIMVMHGAGRNGDEYRDSWVEDAEARGFVVVAPEFSGDHYPGSRSYNLGNLFDEEGESNPSSHWSYGLVEEIFDDAVARLGSLASGYGIFGHSAGSQFVHRFLLFHPRARAERVVLGNAGWYTLPTADAEWPYGIGGPDGGEALVADDALAGFFQRDVTVLLADQDIDPEASNLRNTGGARAQGPHRFARGHHYFEVARERARELGVEFGWQLDTVPDVAHEFRRMAPPAATILVP